MRRPLFIAALVVTAAAVSPAWAQEKGRLALFGAEVSPDAAAQKPAVDEGVYDAVKGTGKFEILRDHDLFKILQFDPQIALKNCGIDPLCFSQLGDTIKVFWIVKTVVIVQGAKATIEVSVFNVAGAKLLGALSVSVPFHGANLREEAAKLAVAVLKRVGTGNISVDEPRGGELLVDGAASGTIPALVEGVAAGVHRVRVTLKGTDYWSDDVKVNVGATTHLTPALTTAAVPAQGTPEVSKPAATPAPPKPLPPPFNDPYFYTFGGASVGFLAVAIAMAVMKGSDEDSARSEPVQVKARDYLDSADTKATTANVFFGLGAAALVGTGVAVYLDLTQAPASSSVRLTPTVGPGFAGVAGSF